MCILYLHGTVVCYNYHPGHIVGCIHQLNLMIPALSFDVHKVSLRYVQQNRNRIVNYEAHRKY